MSDEDMIMLPDGQDKPAEDVTSSAPRSVPMLKIERTFKPVKTIKKDPGRDALLHLVPRYEGTDGDALPTMTVRKQLDDTAWNQASIVPLVGGERVGVHPDQSPVTDPQYVRVVHGEMSAVAIFHRSHFE